MEIPVLMLSASGLFHEIYLSGYLVLPIPLHTGSPNREALAGTAPIEIRNNNTNAAMSRL